MVEIVQSLVKLPDLRHLTTNALLPRDQGAAAAEGTAASNEGDPHPPPPSLLQSTARFFLAHLSALESVSLVDVLEVPHEAFLEPKEEKGDRVRRTWRVLRGGEGEEDEMTEV
ncbi:hypothetical protein JCM6882_004100 [Rhodosporidiobolus microsporus]